MIITIKNRQNLLSGFLRPISTLTEITSITLTPEGAKCLARTADNQLILYAQSDDMVSEEPFTLNLTDCKNFEKLLSAISDDVVVLTHDTNSIAYKSKAFKFKYYLLDESLVQQFSLNIDKIEKFETDLYFTVLGEQFEAILKKSSIVSDVNKVYLFFNDGQIYAEITDRAKQNLNSISISLGETTIESNASFPVSLECIRNLTYSKKDVLGFKINSKQGVIIIEIVSEFSKLKYIITTLTK